MKPLTQDQAFGAAMELQGVFFGLADRARLPAEKRLLLGYAVKAGQIAGYILPPATPANDRVEAGEGDAA